MLPMAKKVTMRQSMLLAFLRALMMLTMVIVRMVMLAMSLTVAAENPPRASMSGLMMMPPPSPEMAPRVQAKKTIKLVITVNPPFL